MWGHFEHAVFGFCIWDVVALVVLLAVVTIFLVHRHKQKKREKEFEDQLSDSMAAKITNSTEL